LTPSFAAPRRAGDAPLQGSMRVAPTQGLRVSDVSRPPHHAGLASPGDVAKHDATSDHVSLLPPSLHPTGLVPSFAPPTVPARTERSPIEIAEVLAPTAASATPSSGDAAPLRPSETATWTSLRFVAQLRHTYLLCEGADGIYVLDQHAAAERVAFDKLRKQYHARAVPAQSLLFPLVIEVSEAEAELVDRRAEELVAAGVELRVRGPQTISVHTVPRLLQRASPERLVRDLLSELSRAGERSFSAAVDQAIATMACHGAIRAGDPLSRAEAEALLRALDEADHAGDCPHGRPVVAVTPWSELERRVGRR
jgi:DNA mismatch repair protein MutL